jgi:uncharacterized membrane protein YhaH (DUF805 family)
VQFLKSLFCLLGFDNRTRFFAICSAVYAIFIMLASAFSGNFFISLILLILFSLVLALASLRRLHDAKLNKNWLFAPSLTFALVALVIILSEQHSSYYLLVIPTLCSAVLLTYPSSAKRNFILGYDGPVDMKEYQQETHLGKEAKFRIEPTLVGDNTSSLSHNESAVMQSHQVEGSSYFSESTSSNKQADIGEMIRLKLQGNKKAQIIITSIIALTLIGVAVSWLTSYLNTPDTSIAEDKASQQISNTIPVLTRSHPLVMPDNYTLYLSEHQGITINWQADEVTNTLLWSQLTVQGDESCKQISFNKGEPIRTLSVQVEKNIGVNIDYFASFSPLDSQTLIQALAFRGNFSLCGYDFSLKGSQASLGKNEQYAQWIDY